MSCPARVWWLGECVCSDEVPPTIPGSLVSSCGTVSLFSYLSATGTSVQKVSVYICIYTGKPLNKGTEGGTILCPSWEIRTCSEVHLPLMYVIGGRLLVHCTEGNCSLEVPLSVKATLWSVFCAVMLHVQWGGSPFLPHPPGPLVPKWRICIHSYLTCSVTLDPRCTLTPFSWPSCSD